jgi:hypothetical protein
MERHTIRLTYFDTQKWQQNREYLKEAINKLATHSKNKNSGDL